MGQTSLLEFQRFFATRSIGIGGGAGTERELALALLDPPDGGSTDNARQSLVATFNTAIAFGTGTISVHDASDDSVIDTYDVEADVGSSAGQVEIVGSELRIYTTDGLNVDNAYVLIASTAITDFAGLIEGDWNFAITGIVPGTISDLVADFVGEDEVTLTFTPDGGAAFQEYRSRVDGALVWPAWQILPDAEESFAPNTIYEFQVRNVGLTGKVGAESNTAEDSFTVDTTSEHISAHSSATDAASYNFTSSTFGDVDEFTWTYVHVVNRAAAARLVTALSIGGIAATQVLTSTLNVTVNQGFVAKLTTPGTQAIAITLDGTAQRITVEVFRLNFLQSTTPVLAADSTMSSGVLSASIDVLAGGSLIGVAENGAAGVFTWAGITKRGTDVAPENLQVSAASDDFAAAQTALAVTATAAGPPSALNPRLSLLAFR